MKYELKKIDALIDSLLNQSKDENNDIHQSDIDSIVSEVNEETERIKKSFSEQLFSLKNDKQIERYIQQHQSSLIRICDSLVYHIATENFNRKKKATKIGSLPELYFYIYAQLEEILSYIERYFGKYFNQDEPIPTSYRIIAQMEFQEKLSHIQKPEKCEIFNIALYPIQDFINQNSNIPFKKLIYLKELFKEISSKCVKCKEQKIDCKLSCSLIYLNFNSFKYFSHLTSIIKEDLQREDELAKQIEILSFHLKKLNQAHSKPNFSFKPKQDSIKEQVGNWILEEMSHLEKIHQLTLKFPKETLPEFGVSFKLATKLSVPQFAYFIRILVETGIIQNKNQKDVITFFANHVKTKKAENISVASFHSKYYNIEESTKDFIRKLVINLLKETQRED